MCKTKTRTQAVAQKRVADIQPNQKSGKPAPPPPPPNAFLGKQERVPQLVYVTSQRGDGFLGQAKEYYEFFGIEVTLVRSVHEMVADLAKRTVVFERIGIVSHAHPRGMFLPMFTDATPGTNKDVFNALAKSDYDGLLSMSPFSAVEHHLFTWKTRIDKVMAVARARDATVLKPFGLEKDGTPPAGDLSEFFFHSMDVVFLNAPDNVTLNGGALPANHKKTLLTFVDEILNQLVKRLDGKTVNGRKITAAQLNALAASLKRIPFDELKIMGTFDLNLLSDNMNFFPSLTAMVKAIQGGFREQLEAARRHLGATSRIDVRGCRVGEDGEYLEAIGAFLGKPGAVPTVTGPQLFQAYAQLFFDTMRTRADIRQWLSRTQRMHPPQKLREVLTKWAEIIRVRPLHTDFWTGILDGPAVRLIALAETDVPPLFIPAPGVKQLLDPDVAKTIPALANFFNVPNAAVPNAAAIANLKKAAPDVRTAAATLLASASDTLGADRLQELYERLRGINNAEKQTIVPETPPTPLRAATIRDFQTRLLEHFDAKPLAALKKIMTAAAESLKEGDGLFYYMLFAGLPALLFGRPEVQKNSLVVFLPHAQDVQQSWYRCLWKDPLPPTGRYRNAAVNVAQAHTFPALFNEDHRSIESNCPLPRYGFCIRIRPLPDDEIDTECGTLTNP